MSDNIYPSNNRILIITRNFPPLIGGMERLLQHAFKEITQQYICDVVGPNGSSAIIKPPHNSYECPSRFPFLFLITALIKSLFISGKHKHAFTFAGSGVTAPLAVILKKIFKIPSITYIHGLDLVVESIIYQRLFIPFIRQSDCIIVNSRNTARLAANIGIPTTKIEILHPGVDIPDLEHDSPETFLQQYHLAGKKILLSVGRLVPRKGLAEFISLSLPDILTSCPDTVFVIIGQEPKQSLKKERGVLNNIKKAIEAKNLQKNVLLLGRVEDTVLRQAYLAADLFVFPLINVPGDVEGFGMVATEAAAHGLPTVAFANGGVADAVKNNYSGFLIEDEQYHDFSNRIIQYLEGKTSAVTAEKCRKFALQFSWENFGNRLREICKKTAAA